MMRVSVWLACVLIGVTSWGQTLKSSPVKWRAEFTAPVPNVATWTITPPMVAPDKLVTVGANSVQADLPPGEYTLTGTAKNGGYEFTFSYKFILDGKAPVPAPKITLSATPTNIQIGQYSKLTWKVTGSSEVKLDGVVVKPSDSLVVTPDKTTTYTLTALAAGGPTSTTKVIVTVGDAPQPPPGPNPPPGPSPIPVTGTWVLIVRDPIKPSNLTGDAAQDQINAMTAKEVVEYLKTNCAKDESGSPAYRLAAPSETFDRDTPTWKKAAQHLATVKHPDPPYIMIASPTASTIESFPANTQALLELLKKYKATK